MRYKIIIITTLFLIMLSASVSAGPFDPVQSSIFKYSNDGYNYIAMLSGDGVINPELSFNLTDGYLVPDDPNSTYEIIAPIITFDTQAWESPGGGSITTIYDTNPVILTGCTTVFKKWYQAAISPQSMGYAESPDGVTWTKYTSNPVLSGYFGGDVIKYNNVYYMFANKNGNVTSVHRFTSSDGTTWVYDTEVATKGSGSWSSSGLMYQDVWMDSPGYWKMLVSGTDGGNDWGAGLWTASSPNGTWTVYESNPVITKTPSGSGSGLTYLPSGTYKDPLGYTWTWMSNSDSPSSNAAETDTMRYRTNNSNDLTSWSANPSTYLNVGLTRFTGYGGDWQGRSPQNYVRAGNLTYEFYTYNTAGNPGYDGVLITPLRIDQIVATNEMYPNLTSQQYAV